MVFFVLLATLTSAQAASHVGERATVCGTVAGIHVAERSKGKPTFLNLDKPYPNAPFTIVIWVQDRPEFGNLRRYDRKKVCATGKIGSFRDSPQIVATKADQLTETK